MFKIEKILFYLLIFSLPFETRLVLYQWGSEFNEWTSAFLYLTDLLVVGLFLSWFWNRGCPWGLLPRGSPHSPVFLILFFLVAFISLIKAANFWLGFYQWLKLLEFILLFFYIKYNFKNLFDLKRVAQIFIISGLFQSVIAIGQYAKQASLGLWWLGESPLAPDIIGVAKIVVDGTKMIRGYGTFPHSNVLAAFLFIALFFLYFLWLKDKIHYGLLAGIFGLLFFTLFLTFSRTIILVFLSVSLLYFIFLFKNFRKKIIYLFLLITLYSLLFTALAWPEISSRFSVSLTDQAVDLRAFYNQKALLMIKNHPFWGIGLGNFIWQLKQTPESLALWLYQPVHNIYLLIAGEAGLIGLGVFLIFIIFILRQGLKNIKQNFYVSGFMFQVSGILFIGLFDHFFWTLQQGQLMFWILLGMLAFFNKIDSI